MLLHDITNNKYYHDGKEISAEEYNILYHNWKDNLPPPSTGEPEISPDVIVPILLGGAE